MNNSSDLQFSHINTDGSATMVDVDDKQTTTRIATARSKIIMQAQTLTLLQSGNMPKGDVLSVARIAGIMAAKKTADLIPMCHQLNLSKVSVEFTVESDGIVIEAMAKLSGKTGVEMEALTAASVSALTIYDMCKAVDKYMIITNTTLVQKSGGKTDIDYR